MNGGSILSQLVTNLTEKYGKDVARTAFSSYGDDVAKKGANSFLARELAGTNNVPKMVSYHSLPEDKMEMAINSMDSHLVNPSFQNVDPAKNMGGDFGEIVLLGNKDLVNSAKPNVASYNRDVYSPRFPQIDDEGNIAFSNIQANADSVSRHMNKSATVGSEEGFWGGLHPATLAAKQAKKFKNVRDMVEHQDNIMPYDVTRTDLDSFRDDLADTVGSMSDTIEKGGSNYGWSEAEADLADMMKGKAAFYDYTPEQLAQIDSMRKRSKTLPTDYFETKVTRPVKLDEISGAILPEDFNNAKILAEFERRGIPVVDRYNRKAMINDDNQNSSLQAALQRLTSKDRLSTPYLLGTAGAIPTAGALAGLFGGNAEDDTTFM